MNYCISRMLKMNRNLLLVKAALNAAENLDLDEVHLGLVLGLNDTTITQLKVNGELDSLSKAGQRALQLIKIFKLLHILSGGDVDWMRHFMQKHNSLTGGVPVEQIKSEEGLVKVTQCLQNLLAK